MTMAASNTRYLCGHTKLAIFRNWGVYDFEPFPFHDNYERPITEAYALNMVIKSRSRKMETKLGVVGV